MSKKSTINRKYHLFDAENKVLGRLATEVVKILRGKNKVDFTPNIDAGDFAVVINSDKIKATGNKNDGKIYHRFSGYPGGITSINLQDQMEKDSTKVVKDAVYRMLPKNKLSKKVIQKLKAYAGPNHPHASQKPEALNLN